MLQHEILDGIMSISNELVIPYVDLNRNMRGKTEFYVRDNVHLNRQDRGEITRFLYEQIDWERK